MSDITLELGPSNGDPVSFEVGATAADPVTFDLGTGGGGTTVHNQLTGRDTADAHPIAAITGLQDALDALEGSGGATVYSGTLEIRSGSDGSLVDLGSSGSSWMRWSVNGRWCHWEARVTWGADAPVGVDGSWVMVLPVGVKQETGILRHTADVVAVKGTPASPQDYRTGRATGGDLSTFIGIPVPSTLALFDLYGALGSPPFSPGYESGVGVPWDWHDGSFLRFYGQYEVADDVPTGSGGPFDPPIPIADVDGLQAALDALEGGGSGPSLSDATPQPPGSASPGTGTAAARDDHVHAPPSAGQIGAATSDDISTAINALGLGNAATKNVGTSAGTVASGDDARLSDTRTPTDASVTAAKLAAALANRIPTRVRITSNVDATTTSQVDTTGLSFAVTSGSVYYFTVVLWVAGDTSNDIDVGATFPSGTMRLGFLGPARSGSSTPITSQGDAIITSSGSLTRLGLLTGSDLMVVGHGVFVASASGTVQIRHAKNSNSVTGTASTVKAQSYIEYTAE